MVLLGLEQHGQLVGQGLQEEHGVLGQGGGGAARGAGEDDTPLEYLRAGGAVQPGVAAVDPLQVFPGQDGVVQVAVEDGHVGGLGVLGDLLLGAGGIRHDVVHLGGGQGGEELFQAWLGGGHRDESLFDLRHTKHSFNIFSVSNTVPIIGDLPDQRYSQICFFNCKSASIQKKLIIQLELES